MDKDDHDKIKIAINKAGATFKVISDMTALFLELVCDKKLLKREIVLNYLDELYTITIEKGDTVNWGQMN